MFSVEIILVEEKTVGTVGESSFFTNIDLESPVQAKLVLFCFPRSHVSINFTVKYSISSFFFGFIPFTSPDFAVFQV